MRTMKARANSIAIRALPPVVLALALLVETADAGGTATRIRAFQFGIYRHLEPALYGAATQWAGLKSVSALQGELGFAAIVGLVLVFLFARKETLWAALLAGVGIAVAQGLAWQLFANEKMLLDAATPSAVLAAVFVAGFAARLFEVRRNRAELRFSFRDSLPDTVLHAIAREPSLLDLGGETRIVTCLSCGIRGFPRIAERFANDPSGFTRLINAVMAPLTEDAVSHGGTIVRLDSENFMACWNAPLDDAEHAVHACEAANRMTPTLAEINERLGNERPRDAGAYEPVEIGIGVSTGRVVAGGFAARGRPLYSVTGDATAIAARLRMLSDQYGPAVIVAEETRNAAQSSLAFLEVDFIAARPGDEPIRLYAMLGNPLMRAGPKFRALETFHEHIFQSLRLQQWHRARELIAQCRRLSGASQNIYDLHLARIAYFETHPPGADWDGAFRPILR